MSHQPWAPQHAGTLSALGVAGGPGKGAPAQRKKKDNHSWQERVLPYLPELSYEYFPNIVTEEDWWDQVTEWHQQEEELNALGFAGSYGGGAAAPGGYGGGGNSAAGGGGYGGYGQGPSYKCDALPLCVSICVWSYTFRASWPASLGAAFCNVPAKSEAKLTLLDKRLLS